MSALPISPARADSGLTRMGACRWCGTYRNTQCPAICQPGRLPVVGISRHARRDARTSLVSLKQERLQNALARDR
jgi:hypothetical protein